MDNREEPSISVVEAVIEDPPDGEIYEVVEILIEFREGRHPRPGRIYRVLINDRIVDFHHHSAPVREILHRVGEDPVEGWVLYEILQGVEIRVAPEQTVHFRRHGLERFVTRQEWVTIEVNLEPKKVRPGWWVVAALKEAVGVPPAKVLAEIRRDGTFDNLADAAKIDIKGGEKFISHARRGGSS